MGRLIQVEVKIDKEGLIDELLAYFMDPSPTRNRRPVLDEGRAFNLAVPHDVLESMVLDGVDQREDVADLVSYAHDRFMGSSLGTG